MGRIFKSLTLGGILGFIIGLLFAPQKGEETRKKLQESIEKGKGKFEELKEEFTKKKEEE
ncbi:MAG: YtxH domain-containing protein [Candidatus Margulisiibacteriota bacterium]